MRELIDAKTVDGKGLILGRLASHVAKLLLKGEKIQIINSEKVVVAATKSKSERTDKLRDMGTPFKGPFYPKSPERIVKRAIRGMLPYKQARGREAFGRVRCYMGQPEELEVKEMISIPKSSKDKYRSIKAMEIKLL
jgi:large subunit ribosomal protein L13